MKRFASVLLLCLALTGCTAAAPEETAAVPTEAAAPQNLTLANPWVSYASMEEAENAVGFSFVLPETVAGSYKAESFRVMAGQLMEVTYRDDSFEVIVRQQPGEGQDLSGDYRTYETIQVTEADGYTITFKSNGRQWLYLVSANGYSYSMYAPNQFWGDSCSDFGSYLIGESIK